MSITTISNAKSGGQSGINSCESGIPIMGRTALNGGVYLPVKVDLDGKIVTGASQFFNQQSSSLNSVLVTPNTFTQAEIITTETLFIAATDINIEFKPNFIIPSNTNNGIFDLIVYKNGSNIANYINTLTLGIDPFDPSQSDLDGIIYSTNICHGNVNGFNINGTSFGIAGSVHVGTNLDVIKTSLLINEEIKFALIAHRNHNPDIWGGVTAEIQYNIKDVYIL